MSVGTSLVKILGLGGAQRAENSMRIQMFGGS